MLGRFGMLQNADHRFHNGEHDCTLLGRVVGDLHHNVADVNAAAVRLTRLLVKFEHDFVLGHQRPASPPVARPFR